MVIGKQTTNLIFNFLKNKKAFIIDVITFSKNCEQIAEAAPIRERICRCDKQDRLL